MLTGWPESAASEVGNIRKECNEPQSWIFDDTTAVADTESGKVVGYVGNDIRIFKGIPYAEILSPQDRWTRGAKVRPWTGKRSCRSAGPACPTSDFTPSVLPHDVEALNIWSDLERTYSTEDCLRLNIWTPGIDNKKRQVIVWCHGGGFTGGSSIMSLRYEAQNLARYGDVVVVSMNHRLHALGFLDLSAYGSHWSDSANLGMLDIVDALKWVQTNIANFGGDPAKVMIAGQSGGGAKVLTLCSMPEAKGLFNRAVPMSSGPLPLLTPEQSAARTASFLKRVDISPGNIDALYKLPVEAILHHVSAMVSAFSAARDRFDGWGSADATTCEWSPVVDGRTVADEPTDPKAPSDVPMLIGTVLHETFGKEVLDHPEYMQMTESQARERLRIAFGPSSDAIYDVYEKTFPGVNPYELSVIARAMGHYRALSVKIALRRAALHSAPTYNYWFQWRPRMWEGRLLSCHEGEIPLLFLHSDSLPRLTGGTAEARALSLRMADIWLAFAATGNPNTETVRGWSPVRADQLTTMVLNNDCRIDHGSDLAAIDTYWKARYPQE